MFENQTCLVTGGTGSWGHELVRKLLAQRKLPREIRIFSRNEFAQVQMKRAFGPSAPLDFRIGDVRDAQAVLDACAGVDYVFHLAALKHVPICERQPLEAMKTNVDGVRNVVEASLRQGVKKMIDVSTDKAVDPVNFYGMTKALGERLVLHANDLGSTTRFVCIRGGNVMGTNGSVVPLFRDQIRQTGEVTLTDRRMTRFFLTLSEAIDLLLTAANASVGGETFVMKMNACSIEVLANALARRLSAKPVRIREIGIRPGEKLHEVLISRQEALHTFEFSDRYYVILPTHGGSAALTAYNTCKPFNGVEYHSNASLRDTAFIESLLEDGGFLS